MLAWHHLYYLPRHGINTADCYRYQRDVLGTQLQSQGYVEFYCLTHIHQPMLRRAFLKQETPNNVESQTNHIRQNHDSRQARHIRRISMKCPDCYWECNDYLRIFHPCMMHDDLFHVHCNDEDTNRTLCGIWGFNVTDELEDITCPDCQIIVLNHYVIVEWFEKSKCLLVSIHSG